MHSNSCATRVLYSNGGVTSQVTCRASRTKKFILNIRIKITIFYAFVLVGPTQSAAAAARPNHQMLPVRQLPNLFAFRRPLSFRQTKSTSSHLVSSCQPLSTLCRKARMSKVHHFLHLIVDPFRSQTAPILLRHSLCTPHSVP